MGRRGNSKKNAKTTIAITGALSFLGSNIISRLQVDPNFRLVVIDREKPLFLSENVKFYKVDLTDPSADVMIYDILEKEDVDTFCHFAFFNSYNARSSAYIHEVQVIGTWYILNACARKKIRKFILRSTTEVYGAHPMNPNLIKETKKPEINPNYRQMRDIWEAESLVQRFASKNPNTKVYILRVAPILANGAKNFMTWYLSGFLLFTIFGYDPMVQFIHPEDAIDAFLMVIKDEKPDGIYNIVGKGALPLSYVIRLMGKIGIPVMYSVAFLWMFFLWNLGIVPYPPEHLDYIRYTYVADGRKAQNVLGFIPKYSAKEIVEEFAGYVKLKRMRIV